METGKEIELKLQVACAADWEAICAYVRARGRAAAPVEMEAVYFDTPEADLRRARLAYRVRKEGCLLYTSYILPFTLLFRYDYIHHSIDVNKAYYFSQKIP